MRSVQCWWIFLWMINVFNKKTCLLLVANFILTPVVLQETPASPLKTQQTSNLFFMGGLLLTGCPMWTSLKTKLKPDALQSISSSTAFRQRKPWASGAFYGGVFFFLGDRDRVALGERRQDSPVVDVFSKCRQVQLHTMSNHSYEEFPTFWSTKNSSNLVLQIQKKFPWHGSEVLKNQWFFVDWGPHVRLLAVACAYLKCPAMVLKPKQSHEDLQSLLLYQGRKDWWRSVSCQLWALLILLWWRHLLPSCINNIQ